MIVEDYKKLIKLEKARSLSYLHFVDYSINDMFENIKQTFFPMIHQQVDFFFVVNNTLACTCFGDLKSTIYIHQIMNHYHTPKEVISLVLKHELLHLIIKPRIMNRKKVFHTEEFWIQENLIAPERECAWVWIMANYRGCLKRRPNLERVDVLPNWKKVYDSQKRTIQESYNIFISKMPDYSEYHI